MCHYICNICLADYLDIQNTSNKYKPFVHCGYHLVQAESKICLLMTPNYTFERKIPELAFYKRILVGKKQFYSTKLHCRCEQI